MTFDGSREAWEGPPRHRATGWTLAIILSFGLWALLWLLTACQAPVAPPAPGNAPEPVTIQGYAGPAEDPALSPDGSVLFFDSHVDAPQAPIWVYWASRVDYKTWTFRGPVGGVDQPDVEAFGPTLDRAGNLYLATTVYGGMVSIARGTFSDNAATGIAQVGGLPPPPHPPFAPNSTISLSYGAVSPDGGTLVLTTLAVATNSNGQPTGPTGGTLSLWTKNAGGGFAAAPDALQAVNALGGIVYDGNLTADGLALYFARSDVPGACGAACSIQLYRATRSSTAAPFGTPAVLATPFRTAEAPFPSPDGRVYFHQVLSPSEAQIYVMMGLP